MDDDMLRRVVDRLTNAAAIQTLLDDPRAEIVLTEKSAEELGPDIVAAAKQHAASVAVRSLPDDEEVLLVCIPYDRGSPKHFADNVIGECCDCTRTIQHRPDVPKKAKPICTACTVIRQAQEPDFKAN